MLTKILNCNPFLHRADNLIFFVARITIMAGMSEKFYGLLVSLALHRLRRFEYGIEKGAQSG